MGLATDAVNLGRYQAARLRMPQTEAKVARCSAGIDAQWPYAKGQPLQVHILGRRLLQRLFAAGRLDRGRLRPARPGRSPTTRWPSCWPTSWATCGSATSPTRPAPRSAQRAAGQPARPALHRSAPGVPAGGPAGAAAQRGDAGRRDQRPVHFLSNVMVEPVHTRAQEDEADCIGYDLSQAAAFAADSASAQVFDTIQADQQKRDAMIDTLDDQLKQQLSQAITTGAAQSFLTGGVASATCASACWRARAPASRWRGRQRALQRAAAAPPAGGAQDGAWRSIPTDAYPARRAAARRAARLADQRARHRTEFAQGKLAVEAVDDAKRARAEGDYADAPGRDRAGPGDQLRQRAAGAERGGPAARRHGRRRRRRRGSSSRPTPAPTRPSTATSTTCACSTARSRTTAPCRFIQEGTARFDNDPKPFISLMIAVARQAGRQDEVAGICSNAWLTATRR